MSSESRLPKLERRRDTVPNEDEPAFFSVVVIGAGISGISAGCQLRDRLGCEDFRIFERHGGLGVR